MKIEIDDLRRIIKYEWWPFIQNKFPKNAKYDLTGNIVPYKIYSNDSKKFLIFGFGCTVTTYQVSGYEDPTKNIGPCWIGIGVSQKDRKLHLTNEQTFNKNMDDYMRDRKANGRDNMKRWKRLEFKTNDKISLKELEMENVSGYTFEQVNLQESNKIKYTKKQITEAIDYWKKVLESMNESESSEEFHRTKSYTELSNKETAKCVLMFNVENDKPVFRWVPYDEIYDMFFNQHWEMMSDRSNVKDDEGYTREKIRKMIDQIYK